MQYLISVIDDTAGLATEDEMAAVWLQMLPKSLVLPMQWSGSQSVFALQPAAATECARVATRPIDEVRASCE